MAGKEDPRLVPRGSYVCAVCHQPLRDVVVGRRKVLGATTPVWGPGPCENPGCPRYGRPPDGLREGDGTPAPDVGPDGGDGDRRQARPDPDDPVNRGRPDRPGRLAQPDPQDPQPPGSDG